LPTKAVTASGGGGNNKKQHLAVTKVQQSTSSCHQQWQGLQWQVITPQ